MVKIDSSFERKMNSLIFCHRKLSQSTSIYSMICPYVDFIQLKSVVVVVVVVFSSHSFEYRIKECRSKIMCALWFVFFSSYRQRYIYDVQSASRTSCLCLQIFRLLSLPLFTSLPCLLAVFYDFYLKKCFFKLVVVVDVCSHFIVSWKFFDKQRNICKQKKSCKSEMNEWILWYRRLNVLNGACVCVCMFCAPFNFR